MSDDTNPGEGNGIADLRKQYEAMKKQNDELTNRLASFEAKERESAVKAALKAKGLPEKVASLYTGDDVSDDAVGKWAEEYKDVFGVQAQSANQSQQAPGLDPALQQVQRISDAAHGSENTISNSPDNSQIVGDPVEMLRLMKTLPYEELEKRGWVPKTEGTLYANPSRR